MNIRKLALVASQYFLIFHNIDSFKESRPVISKHIPQFGPSYLKQRTKCKNSMQRNKTKKN